MKKTDLIEKLVKDFIGNLEQSLGCQIQNLSYSKEQGQIMVKQNEKEGDLKE